VRCRFTMPRLYEAALLTSAAGKRRGLSPGAPMSVLPSAPPPLAPRTICRAVSGSRSSARFSACGWGSLRPARAALPPALRQSGHSTRGRHCAEICAHDMGASQAQAAQPAAPGGRCLLTASVTATTVSGALEELNEVRQVGADVAELRLDFLSGFDADRDLAALLAGSPLPVIVTFRPSWEGGSYGGPEEPRLAALWRAVQLGAAYVDVELKAASKFFASTPQGVQRSATGTKIILSSHNYVETPSLEELRGIHRLAVKAGADIVKVAAMCQCITDVHRLVALLAEERTRPTIALGMGEAGQVRGHFCAAVQPPSRHVTQTSLPCRCHEFWRPNSAGSSLLGPFERARSPPRARRQCSS
jgi:3-dehydroquinate dehydratase type I